MFNEKDHPRDSDGKFTDGSEHSESKKVIEATKKYSSDPRQDLTNISVRRQKEKGKPQDEFFGEEFTGVKGADAIEKLLKEKRGHVKNAFERPEIGGIDLVWGNENGGLLHTIMKRDKLLANGIGSVSGIDMVKKVPDIIEKGSINQDSKGRINIDYDGFRVGIMPAYFDNKVNWIVTAMEILK